MSAGFPAVTMTGLPVHRYADRNGEWFYVIEASEADVLKSGYIPKSCVPSASVCSFKRIPGLTFSKCSRLKGGRLRIRMVAESVIRRDKSFRAFMGSILADTRFSAIRGERPEAY